ncbi:hypothetical protein GF359_05815 [candidate division WOR-3 bacterium]|uniref:Uncharacterized protein n=1 Tax=candidate division WOR-3 bacterium TaxID=2052148 RepID=A0A9D5KAN4_UNCW3|nr:hypothetical protein [candidate division WOR-3 bacterium]MBD3364714.1 hypothetical protein [candidate division WOR-3 bacterium]
MEQEKSLDDRKRARFDAFVDIYYLLGLACIYVTSLAFPIIGIVMAIILKTGALSERTKKVGSICLILGLIGIGIWLLVGIGVFIVATMFLSTYGWYW